MMSLTDICCLTVLSIALNGCSSSDGNSASSAGGAGGTTSSQTDQGAGGVGGDVASSGGLGGTPSVVGSGGGGGGCPSPPTPEQCAALAMGDCFDAGCVWILAVYEVSIDEQGCQNLDSEGCFAIDQCAHAEEGAQGYYRGDEVIETSFTCGLLGWARCMGEPGEPEACSCIESTNASCE